MAKAVFLDRDETLNPDPGYISDAEQFSLYPWVPGLLRQLKDAGYLLIIVSNQSGIGRGIITEGALDQIHQKLNQLLKAASGIEIDDFKICPHRPEEGCECRKPKPALIEQAIEQFNIDKAQSFLIGDRFSDQQAGERAGLKKSFLIAQGDERTFSDAVKEILFKSNQE